MAVGSGSNAIPGPLEINAPQSASNAANVPQAVLDDPVNGSVVLHLGGHGPAPTPSVNANAGTGGAPAASLDASASDLAGILTLTGGTASWATGTRATITLGTPVQEAGYPVFFPADAATAALAATVKPYATMTGKTAFNLAFDVADSAQHTTNWFHQFHGQ